MKTKLTYYGGTFILLLSLFISVSASGQCVPLGPEECPDPENNGQVCPDTLPTGYLDQAYSAEATILVPTEYGTGFVIHHLTLVDVENLPTGLSWESNAENNEFLAGGYYCMLLEGTPTVADTFFLKIVIDVYLNLGGQPFYFTQVVDSTSLSMVIYEDFGLDERMMNIELGGSFPNPFNEWTTIRFHSGESGRASLEVYSVIGEKLSERPIEVVAGDNQVLFNGGHLPAGTYCYVIRTSGSFNSGIFIRKD